MAIVLVKNNEEPKAPKKISILAKKPAKGGTPAKLKKVNTATSPNKGFDAETWLRSAKVLAFFSLPQVFNDKTIHHAHKLVII